MNTISNKTIHFRLSLPDVPGTKNVPVLEATASPSVLTDATQPIHRRRATPNKRNNLKSFVLLPALLLTLSVPALRPAPVCAQTQTGHTLTPAQRKNIFMLVWTRVRDRHYDPKMNGVDWNAVRTRYEPRALKATTEAAFYQTLNEMLGELKQSHLGVRPPEDAEALSAGHPTAPGSGTGDTGLTALLIGGQAVVTRVEPGSGADKAGLKPGFVLTAIGGKPLAPLIKRILERKPAMREGEQHVAVWALARGLLAGQAGQKVSVTASSGGNEPNDKTTDARPTEAKAPVTNTPNAHTQTYEITRQTPSGQFLQFGALPPLPSEVEIRRLDGNIGYVRFNIFLFGLMDQVRQAVQKMAADHVSGIILDLRENPGGIGAMAESVAGLFMDKQTDLGTMRTRALSLKFPVFPQPPRYTGPLVILTDEASLSTSELLAGGLQEIKRAVIVGRPTGGMVLPSEVEELPGGGEFQYVFADFHTPKGVRLEGRGVLPDLPVELTPGLLLAHPDPILDKAIDYVRGQAGKTTVSAPPR